MRKKFGYVGSKVAQEAVPEWSVEPVLTDDFKRFVRDLEMAEQGDILSFIHGKGPRSWICPDLWSKPEFQGREGLSSPAEVLGFVLAINESGLESRGCLPYDVLRKYHKAYVSVARKDDAILTLRLMSEYVAKRLPGDDVSIARYAAGKAALAGEVSIWGTAMASLKKLKPRIAGRMLAYVAARPETFPSFQDKANELRA